MTQHRLSSTRSTAGIFLALFALASSAGEATSEVATLSPNQRQVVASETMQAAHPDFRWFHAGMRELERDRTDLAQAYFARAARYASKPAQAMLAELLWEGRGGPRNPAQAYAWMDLAAERGYVVFVAHREKYWNALSPLEREAAVAFGRGLYAEYGDDVAKPRLEAKLRKARSRMTGSRTGASAGSGVRVFGVPNRSPNGSVLDLGAGRVFLGNELNDFYAARYWKPREYWQWQDDIYADIPQQWTVGSVEVGDIDPKH